MTAPSKLRVRLLLTAGHVREWICDAEDPVVTGLLSALPGAMIDPALPGDGVIQVNAGPGQRLFLSRSSLVAVEINDVAEAPPAPPPVEPVPLFVFRDFLDPAMAADMLRDAAAREAEFAGAVALNADDGFRKARVRFDFPLKAAFEAMVRTRLGDSMRSIGVANLATGKLETQLTVSGDGDYFRAHVDNGHAAIGDRRGTYVYYMHRDPKPFRGGELRLFNRRWINGAWVGDESFRDVAPEHNMLVVFPSDAQHEICRIASPSREFADSRFTVNGWLHGDAAPAA